MSVSVEVAAKLQDMDELLQEEYLDMFDEQTPKLHGSTINKYFTPSSRMIVGDGITVQYEERRGDSVRPMKNLLADFNNGDRFEPGKIKIRKNDVDTSANDVCRLSGSAQTTILERMEEGSEGKVIDFVEKLYKDIFGDYDNKLAVLRHSPKSGRIALVNGTPLENDSWYVGGATATADNTDGLRCHVDSGQVSKFFAGLKVDFYSSAGVIRAGNIRVTDVNPADESQGSIGFEFVTGEGDVRDSTGNLANVVDDDEIYLSGARGGGTESLVSLEEYFTRPTAGESFLGGKDRTTKENRWMLPLLTRENGASQVVEQAHFDEMGDALQMQMDEVRDSGVITTTPKIHSKLKRDIGNDAFLNIPIDDSRLARFANFGNIGLNYQHPILGTVKFVSDPLQRTNTIRLVLPHLWTTFFAYFKGIQLVPGGDSGLGGWYRASAETAGTGKGLVVKRDYMAFLTDYCMKPWMQIEIGNITHS